MSDTLLIRESKKRHTVLRQDKSGRWYVMKYDPSNVYTRNDGQDACLKCMAILKRLWSTDSRGEYYCPDCEETKGGFGSFGYVEVLNEGGNKP
jgi:formamidopyrimidine-DNA glycosylase